MKGNVDDIEALPGGSNQFEGEPAGSHQKDLGSTSSNLISLQNQLHSHSKDSQRLESTSSLVAVTIVGALLALTGIITNGGRIVDSSIILLLSLAGGLVFTCVAIKQKRTANQFAEEFAKADYDLKQTILRLTSGYPLVTLLRHLRELSLRGDQDATILFAAHRLGPNQQITIVRAKSIHKALTRYTDFRRATYSYFYKFVAFLVPVYLAVIVALYVGLRTSVQDGPIALVPLLLLIPISVVALRIVYYKLMDKSIDHEADTETVADLYAIYGNIAHLRTLHYRAKNGDEAAKRYLPFAKKGHTRNALKRSSLVNYRYQELEAQHREHHRRSLQTPPTGPDPQP